MRTLAIGPVTRSSNAPGGEPMTNDHGACRVNGTSADNRLF